MYGRYSESLGDYAREEAERQRVSEKGIESIHRVFYISCHVMISANHCNQRLST